MGGREELLGKQPQGLTFPGWHAKIDTVPEYTEEDVKRVENQEARIVGALRDLGKEHEPSKGWESKVLNSRKVSVNVAVLAISFATLVAVILSILLTGK